VETDNIKGSLIYEPKLALDGGGDGLELIRRILEQAPGYIRTGGFLVLEFGWQHKPPISDIIKANGRYEIREWIKDYDGNWRGVVLQRINER
jgi:release factor glutamine methyltransferase